MAVPAALAQLAEPYFYTFTLTKGDTFTFAPQFTDEDGAALPLTGCTAQMEIRATYGTGATLIATATCVVTELTGTITCTISAATTAAITAPATLVNGKGLLGVTDLELTDGTIVKTLLSGPVYMQVDVTA